MSVAPLSRRTILSIISGLLIGVFLSALDSMIMASALRTIADQLNGITFQAWATTAYLITSTISTPLYGKLSDIFGRKRLYLVAISLFLVGSLLCGIAQSMYQLALYRGVQGLGAGGLMSLALAVFADLLPREQRARYQANLGVVFGVASVSGPVVGGFFAGLDSLFGLAGWRWIFLLNLPIGLVALVLVGTLFRSPATPRRSRRIDYAGSLLLVTGIVPMLLIIERGRDWGWASPRAIVAYAVGVVALVLFVAVERRRGDDALLPPKLFRVGVFRLVNTVNFLGGVGVFTGLTFLPLYLQIGKGMSPTAAGLMLLPQSLATTVGARLCGPLIERTGRYRELLAAGLATMMVSYLTIAFVDNDTSLWIVGAVVVLMGLGLGIFMQVVLIAMQNSVPPENLGVASGLYNFSRQMGGAVGVAILFSLLFALVPGRIADAYGAQRSDPGFQAAASDPAVLGDPVTRTTLEQLRDGTAGRDLKDTSFLGTIDERIARPLLDGFTSGINTIFLIAALIMAIAVGLTLTLPRGSARQ
ncbi:MFS transporter [Frankia sp. AiPs1]|uniref:MDR family MFS transporter n=1 Tax=Frankia sp. AiPs1 TaxID=573493 RepID=UPI002043634B|nr:MDR family MFS transporter [Frankia sp. AiPs1]MCM3920974.1 MFS transporter [Frankia sp. AiPs1]